MEMAVKQLWFYGKSLNVPCGWILIRDMGMKIYCLMMVNSRSW